MTKLDCRILAQPAGNHAQQVFTGFEMLHRHGIVRLTQETRRREQRGSHIRVIVNHDRLVHYDLADYGSINEVYLDEADFYFKRSYAPQRLATYGSRSAKIHPLGLNYLVYPDSASHFALQRALARRRGWRSLLRECALALNLGAPFAFSPRANHLESPPDLSASPRLLFITRPWDPNQHDQLPPDAVEDRHRINEVRAQCIELLRKEFGPRFSGGFVHTEYAVNNYRDLLIADPTLTSKRRYLEHLRRFPVCITTTGLHGSIGWKLGEYVAFSKAIVTEALQYQVPGKFEDRVNFAAFDTPQACVEEAAKLCDNDDLRRQMMVANFRYYHHYVRPDALVLNSLARALALATER